MSLQKPFHNDHDDSIKRKFEDVVPTVEKILNIGGSAGASVGISVDGRPIFRQTFGYQDLATSTKTQPNTVYTLGSLTKAFVSTIAAHYVSEGVLNWSAPLTEYVPEFAPRFDPTFGDRLTLVDLLSHRTDLIRKDLLWLGANNEILVKKEDLLQVVNSFRPVYPVRSRWFYNNWMYALAGEILERKTGKPFADLMQHVITGPFRLHDTSTDLRHLPSSQLAKPYMVGDNGELFKIGSVGMTSGSLMETAGGVRSSIDDLIAWTTAIMGTRSDQGSYCLRHSRRTSLRLIEDVLSGQMIMLSTSGFDQLYAMGWAKVTTPSSFGNIGFNPGLVSKMPVLGSTSAPRLVYYHNGAIPGFNNAIFMIPELRLNIVVLTNSIGQGDIADWIGQLLLQTALDTQNQIDFLSLAKEAAGAWRGSYVEMESVLASERINGTKESEIQQFVGTYWHTSGAVKITVKIGESHSLKFILNDSPDQVFDMVHYNYEVYSFFPSREDRIRRGLIVYDTATWLIHFHRNANGEVNGLRWYLDPDEPDGDDFLK